MFENSDISENEVKILGFLVKDDRQKIEEKMPQRLAEYDNKVGRKKYIPTNFYSISEALFYQKVACEMLFGSASLENYYKMGAWDFRMLIKSQYGRIAKVLFASNLKSALLNFSQIINAGLKGVKISAKEISEKEIHLCFENNPFTWTFWQGFIEEGLKYYKKIGSVKMIEKGENVGCLVVTWS